MEGIVVFIPSIIIALISIGGCASLAKNRGHSVGKWVFYAILLGPLALIFAFFLKDQTEKANRITLAMPLPPGPNDTDR